MSPTHDWAWLKVDGRQPEPSCVQSLNQLAELCVEYSQRRLSNMQTELPHMRLYKSWMQTVSITTIMSIKTLSDHKLFEMATAHVQSLAGSPVAAIALAMFKIMSGVTAIYGGRVSPLTVLRLDETCAFFEQSRQRKSPAVDKVCVRNQDRHKFTVLELGTGTSMCTIHDLRAPAFDSTATEHYKDVSVQYANLDIGRDPLHQGFQQGQFDVIVATDALYTTAGLSESLSNMRRLLCPGGRLVVYKLPRDSLWMGFLHGILPSWWIGDAEHECIEDLESEARWEWRRLHFEPQNAIAMPQQEVYQYAGLDLHDVSRAQPIIDII